MSAGNALRRLVRWRSFGESQAADVLRRRSAEATSAQADADAARDVVVTQQALRGGLLAPGLLDLGLLQAAAQVEGDAQACADRHAASLRIAREAEALAGEAHLQARASTRVADGRRARQAASEADRREKAEFDHVADAHQASAGRARGGKR